MTHSSVTSNPQVVNTAEHRICMQMCVCMQQHCPVSGKTDSCVCRKAPCCVWVSYVRHVWRMTNRTTPSILCTDRLRWPSQSTPLSHPHLQPPICLLQYTHIHITALCNQWEATGGARLKVNVCTWSLAKTWREEKSVAAHFSQNKMCHLFMFTHILPKCALEEVTLFVCLYFSLCARFHEDCPWLQQFWEKKWTSFSSNCKSKSKLKLTEEVQVFIIMKYCSFMKSTADIQEKDRTTVVSITPFWW